MASLHLICPACGAPVWGTRPLVCLRCGVALAPEGDGGAEIKVTRLGPLHERVATDLGAGRTVETIERWIDQTPGLDDDERSALWLYAWTKTQHKTTRSRRPHAASRLLPARGRRWRGQSP